MNQKERIEKIIEALDAQYGTDFICYLEHKDALELLIATILSAQCTDARVNTVTPTLFAKYKNAKDFANANLAELEEIIHPTLPDWHLRNLLQMPIWQSWKK